MEKEGDGVEWGGSARLPCHQREHVLIWGGGGTDE